MNMKNFLTVAMAFGLAVGTARAQNGNPCPGEKEYQVNILGTPNQKNINFSGGSGHRIFIPRQGNTKIFMTGDTDTSTTGLQCGSEFFIRDADGTDGEATLVVPCQNVNSTTPLGGPLEVCFNVWATPLGKPGGTADVDVVCTFDTTGANDVVATLEDGSCLAGQVDFSLTRGGPDGNKPNQLDISKFMRVEGCFDTNHNDICDPGEKSFDDVWIFNLDALLSYYWDVTNDGLRLAMIRFCDTDCGTIGTVPGTL